MHRLPGHSKPAQLFLPFWAELRGFGGRQMPGATGFSGCGAALAAQFELQFGEAGHDGRDSSPCWRGRIDAFAQDMQSDSPFTEIADGAGDPAS